MKTTSWRIKGGFGRISEVFNELSQADRARRENEDAKPVQDESFDKFE